MTTNIKKLYFPIVMAALVSSLIISCEKDDNTGAGTLTPATPTISVTPNFTSPESLVENDSVFEYTVTMSVAQLVDVKLNVAQVDGTASADDYEMSSEIYFFAGATTAKGKIKILSDELIEDTENLIIQIGDNETANATFAPITYEFTISNLTGDDLAVHMSWTTDAADAIGLDLDPTEAVDMRLLVIHADTVYAVADGSSFEDITGFDAAPDGTYTIATDIYATVNAGDFNAPITIDINLEFNQIGVVNGETLAFPAVMTNEYACESYRIELATITKNGDTYTFEKSLVVPGNSITGVWQGIDVDDESGYHDYESQVETILGCVFEIRGLGYSWMTDFWGETIIDAGTVELLIDETAETVTIEEQYYLTTTYKDVVQDPYTITGTGTYDDSGDYPTMTIEYELTNNATGWANWCYENEYLSTPLFVAHLTLDPAGLKSAGIKTVVINKKPLVKPSHK
ncbi:MAG TPA: hypothetical protein DEQ03_11450 [Marinilabiliales bacterium]|nr:hypothetical protein [Marinilabiliales bacterium]